MQSWAAAAFSGLEQDWSKVESPSLEVLQQDYGQLQLKKSVMQQPLLIGTVQFEHGLGTHANSDLLVNLPSEARTFKAMVGVDSDHNHGGSVVFIVHAGGKTLYRSPTLRGGDPPLAVSIDLPRELQSMRLKTDTTPDGASADHADWADARIVGAGGQSIWLDELPLKQPPPPQDLLRPEEVPFSFAYDGVSSREFLPMWKRADLGVTQTPDGPARDIQWIDPGTRLAVQATVTPLVNFPAVQWVLRFTNTSASDSAILEDVQALDTTLETTPAESNVILNQINGSTAAETDFVPEERKIGAGETVHFASRGGRSSDTHFPFFDLRFGSSGLIVAIGWTGQWAARLDRVGNGPTRLRGGMELTHLKLHPGESIRSPRILLMRFSGDRDEAHNLFRRLMLAHFSAKAGRHPVKLAIGAQSFNSWYLGKRPNWATEAGQIASARINQAIGADTLWMDAGWFPGGFPNGAGNWIPRPNDFPHGLAPIGDECRKLGLRFLVWFEPERVVAGTTLATEHPEFILGGKGGGLFNLGDEKARRFMTDLIDHDITDWQLSCYRQDSNIDPLPFWRRNDATDRQGITEIRHVEGMYAMWDELRARHPNLYIDNCSSGGRRIDIECCKRAVVQTRSDSEGTPGRADWEQSQTWGLSQYIPLAASFTWDLATYDFRSYATSGFLGEWDILAPDFPVQTVRKAIEEVRANQKYFLGDYYP